MGSIATEFADALSAVNRPTAFYATGTEQMLAPGLSIDGFGPIALPLLPMQAEQIIATAERAPYGRGEETITDITVRRTWQVGADRVRISGKHWPTTLQAIVTRVAETLGIADPIEAELYKLLIYDEGSFFVPHRDTEKADGMFATLVLTLPSISEGGELIVRHQDREVHLDLRCEEPSDVAFAAFYADCVHEVLPVTSGHRLVLVYNLLRRGPGRLPEVPNHNSEQDAIVTILTQWAEALRKPENEEPTKLIFPLEHAYTSAELDFRSLKGADAGIAPVVVAAARRASCDVHLALVAIEESGISQYNGDYHRSRRGRYRDDDEDGDEDNDDEFEIVEVCESHAVASDWHRPDGEPSPLTDLPMEEDEFSPPMSFEDFEPDEQHFQEATGNEGASFERSYRGAALILWPHDQLLGVINQGGWGVTVPYLEAFADRWVANRDPTARNQVHELSQRMTANWPRHEWFPRRDTERTDTGKFLAQLVRLEDTAQITSFLGAIATCRGFDIGDCADIADAIRAVPPDRASALTESLIEAAAELALGACADLLARLAAIDPAITTRAARKLVAALPGDPARGLPNPDWRRTAAVRPAFIVDVFTALGRIDPTLAAGAAERVLRWPGTYDFDTVLIPAMHTLLETPETAGQPAVQRLRTACLAHLEARIALPLEAPGDWRREDKLACDCKDCTALGVFLRDATQRVWVFAAAEPRRRHVEATIRTSRPDVDTATEKKGSPHRLICTKNQASFERRVAQRVGDLAEQERLTV
jgi:predicted 2-oxoglutarate/Fe(II)-dependent dioxygenase YbiX